MINDTQDHGKDIYGKQLGQVTDYGRSSAEFINFRKGCVDGDFGVARRRKSAVYSGGDYLFYSAHGMTRVLFDARVLKVF